jgi:hypothetical protein
MWASFLSFYETVVSLCKNKSARRLPKRGHAQYYFNILNLCVLIKMRAKKQKAKNKKNNKYVVTKPMKLQICNITPRATLGAPLT